MPAETIHFRCPCCGQHAPVERVTQEQAFVLAQFTKSLGGKAKLTYEEKLERPRKEVYRGSGAGKLDYDEVPVSPELLEAIRERIRVLATAI